MSMRKVPGSFPWKLMIPKRHGAGSSRAKQGCPSEGQQGPCVRQQQPAGASDFQGKVLEPGLLTLEPILQSCVCQLHHQPPRARVTNLPWTPLANPKANSTKCAPKDGNGTF